MAPLRATEPLRKGHDRSSFDSGALTLDSWFRRFAWENHAAGFARVYVTCRDKRVVGYYSLGAFSILRESATTRAAKGGPAQIPALLLGRLAVDRAEQGHGIGAALLRHAMLTAVVASEQHAVRALVVNALDEPARDFYRRYGFEASPTNELDLMILVKDIKATLGP
ncbi:MAG: GNAT family N-acetyltransferase [Acidimicrobiales bacterium]